MGDLIILERAGPRARYVVRPEDGPERQVERDISVEIAASARQHRPIRELLAKAEGITLSSKPVLLPRIVAAAENDQADEALETIAEEAGVELPRHQHPHRHVHDHDWTKHEHDIADHIHDEYLMDMPEHGHSDLDALAEALVGLSERVSVHDHDAKEYEHSHPAKEYDHSHKLQPHDHQEIAARVADLEAAAARLIGHQHDHKHPEHSHDEFVELLTKLNHLEARLAGAIGRIGTHEHDGFAVLEHTHRITHGHPELEEALEGHKATVARQAQWRVLSREEVGGHQRLIVEEIDG